jgi:hypothetical protein
MIVWVAVCNARGAKTKMIKSKVNAQGREIGLLA